MRPVLQEIKDSGPPELWAERLRGYPGVVLLRSGLFEHSHSRYSFLAARPFLTFRSFGTRCEIVSPWGTHVQFGNPWQILESLLARYEILDEPDCPFPLGGCFGYWGYELRHFVEASRVRRVAPDLEFPDCHLGFYDSLIAYDHRLEKGWIISTGLAPDGSRQEERAISEIQFWTQILENAPERSLDFPGIPGSLPIASSCTRSQFVQNVNRVKDYIHAGDIYQVNISQRFEAEFSGDSWSLFLRLLEVSPAPMAAYYDAAEMQILSASPEMFLRISGQHVRTRPIKGTRPRSADPVRDAQLMYELQTSPKEMAELVMITDLLRNDLGRVCDFGSIQVPELVRLERYPQVQHLVSTIEGRLRDEVTHLRALQSCFPGGSITGAPKIRAMEIIDELEQVARGPYTGALGYVGFNRESQINILIRTIVCHLNRAYYHAGAGIVADSDPDAEYEETLSKARPFFSALGQSSGVPTKARG